MPEEDTFDISRIAGNASDEIKQAVGNPKAYFVNHRPHGITSDIFGESIQKRLKVTEISIQKKEEEERKLEARMVYEVDVTEDMLNAVGSIHGGCSAFLVDLCSSLTLSVLTMETMKDRSSTVSQSLNIVYHSPAGLGERLRIVNVTLAAGARAQSVRTEIWNVTHHRLVVSGTHIKMVPSFPKASL